MPNGRESLTDRVIRLEERNSSHLEKLKEISTDTKDIKNKLDQAIERLSQLPCKQDALRLTQLEVQVKTAQTERDTLKAFKDNIIGKWGVIAAIAVAATSAGFSALMFYIIK